jgi:hypothetical protein
MGNFLSETNYPDNLNYCRETNWPHVNHILLWQKFMILDSAEKDVPE